MENIVNSLRNCKEKNVIIKLKFYLKQDKVASPPHNIILFTLDQNVKFPLVRLLQFLSDLKSTIIMLNKIHRK